MTCVYCLWSESIKQKRNLSTRFFRFSFSVKCSTTIIITTRSATGSILVMVNGHNGRSTAVAGASVVFSNEIDLLNSKIDINSLRDRKFDVRLLCFSFWHCKTRWQWAICSTYHYLDVIILHDHIVHVGTLPPPGYPFPREFFAFSYFSL